MAANGAAPREHGVQRHARKSLSSPFMLTVNRKTDFKLKCVHTFVLVDTNFHLHPQRATPATGGFCCHHTICAESPRRLGLTRHKFYITDVLLIYERALFHDFISVLIQMDF